MWCETFQQSCISRFYELPKGFKIQNFTLFYIIKTLTQFLAFYFIKSLISFLFQKKFSAFGFLFFTKKKNLMIYDNFAKGQDLLFISSVAFKWCASYTGASTGENLRCAMKLFRKVTSIFYVLTKCFKMQHAFLPYFLFYFLKRNNLMFYDNSARGEKLLFFSSVILNLCVLHTGAP